MRRYLLLFVSALAGTGLVASGYQGRSAPRRRAPLASQGPAKQYRLCCSLRAIVQGHEITITTATGAVIARNNQLIRLAADAQECPLDGFDTIVAKGNYFTIEQQNCSGWLFINEYTTFRYVPSTGAIELHKFGLSFTDRRAPDKQLPDKIFTRQQFEQRRFGQVTLAALEALDH